MKHFKKNQLVVCDSSREGLGAVRQQQTEESWKATHFTQRVLTLFKQKNSINELELLVVVCAIEILETLCMVLNLKLLQTIRHQLQR